MIIDSHVHVWDPSRASYPWLTEALHPLDRAVLLDDFPSTIPDTQPDGLVLIQAADSAEDTAIMQEQAAIDSRVVGIVAWAPLDRPEHMDRWIADYGRDPLIVGVRTLIHEREPGWLLSDPQTESLGLLSSTGLTYDFVSNNYLALQELQVIGARHPGLRLVIDHLGKPPIGGTSTDRARWRSLIADAAQNPHVFAKLSGLSEPNDESDTSLSESIVPFVEDALEVFGAERLMFGSDWPLVDRGGGYRQACELISRIVGIRGPRDHADVFSRTAKRFYNLQETSS